MNIKAKDIKARGIKTKDIKMGDIKAKDIKTWGIKAKLDELKNSDNLWVIAYLAILTYVVSVVMFTTVFLAAPLLLVSGNAFLRGFAAVAFKMVETFVMCHQLPERSLFLFDIQLPICARDTGIYIGSSLGGLLGLTSYTQLPRFLKKKLVLAVLTLPMIVDGVTQTLLFSRESSNMLRLATGLLFGFGLLYFFTSRISERYQNVNINKSDVFKLAVGVNIVIFILMLATGAYVGTFFTPKQNAVDSALGSAQEHLGYRVYYIPPNALKNVKNDPYLGLYDDAVLRDVARMRYAYHTYGLWLVAAGQENKTSQGKVVYFPETGGLVAYVDARSGKLY